jgi:tRNA (cytidine/uridine-2'-O-)-methyltransferase
MPKSSNFLNVVLYEPEIPQNCGNIARLCACVGAKLYLIGRLGFVVTDKRLKRSGLDYWDKVEIEHLVSLDELKAQASKDADFYYFTTKAKQLYTDIAYKKGDFLVFGPETRGLSEDLLFSDMEHCVKLPMKEGLRSLNLSNSVAVGVYETIRQIGF